MTLAGGLKFLVDNACSPKLADDLRQGALVTIEDTRLRIRRLPVAPRARTM